MSDTLDVPAASSDEAVAALNEGLFALQDALRLPGLEGRAADPPPALLDALDRWWAAYDRYTAVVSDALAVTCRKGCTWCCLDNPRGVTGVELLLAWRAARALPDAEAVMARTRALADEVQRHLEIDPDHAANQRAVRSLGHRCMFLGDDDACRIYASRPVGCRMFVAVTEPALCDMAHPRHDEAVNPHLEPARVLLMILDALSQRLGLAGAPRDLRRGVAWIDDRLG